MTRDSFPRPFTRLAPLALVMLSMLGLLSACGGHHAAKAAPPPSSTTSTTKPHKKVVKAAVAHAPAMCPLTNLPPPHGKVPQRPALAIKVENLPQARPQYGLNDADVVYEEPVEGGITRFIVIFQCYDSSRVEPVRSGRFIDPGIVMQYGAHPLFAYSGAVQPVINEIDSSSLIDVGADRAPGNVFFRDPNRVVPHNLMTSTSALYAFGASEHDQAVAPKPVFKFGKLPPRGTPAASVYIPYQYSPVTWTWHPKAGVYFRSYSDTGPATLGNGGQITATNIVILHMVAYPSPFVEDVNGDHETLLTLTGAGPLEVIRNGAAFSGMWRRPSLSDTTEFLNSKGQGIPLGTGNTWVELVPDTIPYTVTP